MRVISFYTVNTLYENEAAALAASCERHSVAHEILPLQSLGSWAQNCCMKPQFILDRLRVHQEPLLWVDSDGRLLQPLGKMPDSHVAVRINSHLPKEHRSYVITNTLYVRPGAEPFLEAWIAACEKALQESTEEVWDQRCFANSMDGFDIAPLPLGYSQIHNFDHVKQAEQYITHHQASRFYKKLIGETGLNLSQFEGIDSSQLNLLFDLHLDALTPDEMANVTQFIRSLHP